MQSNHTYAMTVVHEALTQLDRMEQSVSDYEADVLETCMRQWQQRRLPSSKQHRILCELVEQYLGDPVLLRRLLEVAP